MAVAPISVAGRLAQGLALKLACAVLASLLACASCAPRPRAASLRVQAGDVRLPEGKRVGRHSCPSFFLLGATRCGTSSLNNLTMENFDFHQTKKNVLAFGSNKPLPHRYGPNVTNLLDSSPQYLHRLITPKQLKETCRFSQPPKFLVTLCNPLDRSWSHYRFSVKRGRIRTPPQGLVEGFQRLVSSKVPEMRKCLKEAYRREHAAGVNNPYLLNFCSPSLPPELGYSLYREQLQLWRHFFPPSSFLVLERSDWTSDLKQTVEQVSRFFEMKPKRSVTLQPVRLGENQLGKELRPKNQTLALLAEVFSYQETWRRMVTRVDSVLRN
mmetsp:Transcript_28663/g.80707  ORF Transcript_28663/g.80707 Transcript_28663/m.80707 type:complete len:326 (-) Transcript_28663:235-1212(-)